MANILYRGSAVPSTTNSAGANNAPLTNDQIDKNLYALDLAKFEKSGGTISGATTFSSDVTVSGNLTVGGTTTQINTTTLQVLDKNIEIGKVATPTDTTADGGGITLLGASNKTIVWDNANSNWTSSENWNIATGKVFKINNVSVLSATTLGTSVVNSSITKIGTTAGFVKSDSSGNLTADTNTYALSSHGHYVGTTAVQSSSADQSLTGISSITGGASGLSLYSPSVATTNTNSNGIIISSGSSSSGNSGAVSISTANVNISGKNAGSISINPGANITDSSNTLLRLSGSDSAVSNGGHVSIYGGSAAYNSSNSASTGGNVFIAGGQSQSLVGTRVGGSVFIVGGQPASSGSGTQTYGSVNIGTYNSTGVSIGQSSVTTTNVYGAINFVDVGTSGFISLGAGGQLSATAASTLNIYEDTNLYYTDARARAAISVTGGALAYNSSTGVITYTAPAAYSLPTATSSVLGGVKPDGTTITNSAGIISVTYGTTATSACVGNDSRLSNSRNAADVYAWAKAATKPSYTQNEIGTGALSATTGTFSSSLSATQLSIASSGSEADLFFQYTGQTKTTYLFKNSSSMLGYYNSTDGGFVFSIDYSNNFLSAGNITANGNVTAYSDSRLKKNIAKIDNALDKVNQLSGYTFDRIDVDIPRQTGVIAQEVLKVLPEAVTGSEETTYSVAYGNMMGLMIEAIKELNAKVEDLQKQLAINK